MADKVSTHTGNASRWLTIIVPDLLETCSRYLTPAMHNGDRLQSSDSVLALTSEALAIYRKRLTTDGILAFHYSSRYLDLRPILARLAASAQPPMTCLFREDLALSATEKRNGKAPSKWALMTEHPRTNSLAIATHGLWAEVPFPYEAPLWTDSSANLLDALTIFPH